ncbi:MAG: non-homologous end-joining DNA ligase [Ilumatobacteraceae bacterium]
MAQRGRTSDERLATYRAKRDFSITAEPSGTAPPAVGDGWRFVVQRHRASHLHYDVRLEADGVLVSWAVPKGPTLDPDARRLAMHVEDHPLDYYDFEGVIAAGEYGAGDVVVWDWGVWALAEGDDPMAEIAKGGLHFAVLGEKLRGRFALVRRGDRRGRDEWMLFKKHDDDAVAGWNPEDHPRSVKSGRTNDDVRDAPAAGWTGRANWAAPTSEELAALDDLKAKGSWTLGGHELRLTNLDKVLFPPRGRRRRSITKRDLIRHYATMAPAMLPYLADRAVNMNRFPDGIGSKGFWHKEAPAHAPDWIRRWRNPDADPGETQEYVVPDSAATLAWLANFGALELHPWTSTLDAPDEPTWALFDIDPGRDDDFDDVVELARLHRTALDHLDVDGCPKVTGKRGIQIWVPVARGYTFTQTRAWVETVSRAIGATTPELVSWEWEVHRRGGLIRLDYTQNAINKTLVAPYSTRPAAGAPVSVPINWDDLDDDRLRPDRWTIHDVQQRLREHGDPLAPLIGRQQRLPQL